MSNSSLANYVNRISGNYGYRELYIDSITITSIGGEYDIYDVAEMVASGSIAYHYAIAGTGTIGLFVDEMYAVYASGNVDLDNRAVQIVTTDYYNPLGLEINEGDIDTALANLVEDICRRNYILKLEDGVNIIQSGGHTVNTSEINQRLTAARISSETEALKAQSSIAVGAIKPYMAIIDPSASPEDFNCEALKNMGVIGLLMYAGCLYDNNHNEVKPYKNKFLRAQMDKVIANGSLWGLLATSRARSLQEAKKEIYWLYFVIAKFPPKLGIWLEPDLSVDSNTARDIVELYYAYFVRWGLIDKCGLYCTSDQARRVDWENFADRMSLWLNEPLSDLSCLEELLTPSLFKFDY